MLRRLSSVLIVLSVLFSLCAMAQERNRGERPPAAAPAASPAEQTKPAAPAAEARKEAPEPAPVVTHHEIHLGGKTLRYTATTGLMPLRNVDTGEVEAHIFFIAYTLDGQSAERRPLTFSFNGGPGSASVTERDPVRTWSF